MRLQRRLRRARIERADPHAIPPDDAAPVNGRSVGARLGLVNVSRALNEPLGQLRAVLEEALKGDEAARHDQSLYEELGRILREDPMAAVDLYRSFPFSSDHDFENALRLAAIKTLLSQKQFDDERLKPLLISIGKGFGIMQINDEVEVLNVRARARRARRSIWRSRGSPRRTREPLSEQRMGQQLRSRGNRGLRAVNSQAARTVQARRSRDMT